MTGRPRVERPAPTDRGDLGLAPSIVDGLLTKTQRRLLRFVFGQPGRTFCIRELRDLTGCGTGATQRELQRLAACGLVTMTDHRGRLLVQANPRSPIHSELAAIVRKTVGLAEPLREAFAPIAWRLEWAFAFEPDRAPGDGWCPDLGVLVIAREADRLGEGLCAARDFAEHLVARPIWIATRDADAWRQDRFVAHILELSGIWVVGDGAR